MSQEDTLLYIGALTDLLPIDAFPLVNRFIYVDQMPNDKLKCLNTGDLGDRLHDMNEFVDELTSTLKLQGHVVDNVDREENKLVFTFDESRILTYFCNVTFPDETESIYEELTQLQSFT